MHRLAGVSVLICCYNSEQRIGLALQYLSQQVVDPAVPWEIIIVDNNSTDKTSEVAAQMWQYYSDAQNKLKVVREEKSGLNWAREKGIASSNFSYIVFCDDDNLLDSGYVQAVFELFEANPQYGIFGSDNRIGIEDRNYVTENHIQDYAVGNQSDNLLLTDLTHDRGFVWGAGMSFRFAVYRDLNSHGFKTMLSDRKGKELSSGGDTEFCFAARLLNWRIGASKRLSLIHNIDPSRFSYKYFLRLQRGFGKANPFLVVYVILWHYKNGCSVPYSYRRELKELFQYVLKQKTNLLYLLTGRYAENHSFVWLHFHLGKLLTLLTYRRKLDKRYFDLIKKFGIEQKRECGPACSPLLQSEAVNQGCRHLSGSVR